MKSVFVPFLALGAGVAAQNATTYDYIVVGSGAWRRAPGRQPRARRPVRPAARGRRRPGQQPEHLQPVPVQRRHQRPQDPLGLLLQALRGPGPREEVRPLHLPPEGRLLLRRHQPAGRRHPPWASGTPRAGTLGGCAMHNAGVTFLPLEDDWIDIVRSPPKTVSGSERER